MIAHVHTAGRSCHTIARTADPIHGLAPREVYRDLEDHSSSGGLLHRRFTRSRCVATSGGFLFCDTAL